MEGEGGHSLHQYRGTDPTGRTGGRWRSTEGGGVRASPPSLKSGRLLQSVTSLKETESCQYNWLKLLLFDGVIQYTIWKRIGKIVYLEKKK
jgi:hypothetical protein